MKKYKYIRTKDGRILALNEFKYEKKYHRYRPNKKFLSRVGIGFSFWNWCFDDEYDLIPDVMGKITTEIIKREECKFADNLEELCDAAIRFDKYKLPLVFNISTGEDFIRPAYETLKKTYKNIMLGVYTDKGLIYVAKTKNKRGLKLI